MPPSTRTEARVRDGMTGVVRALEPSGRYVDIFRNTPVKLLSVVWGAFNAKHEELGGAPGARLTPDAAPERLAHGRRVRYQDGTLYENAAGTVAWVHGLIGERYDQLGGPGSWLGMPLGDESDFADGGRVSVFDNGAIYWWPDVGAIDLRHVAVAYTGLLCFGETDSDGDDTPFADEPYVVLGVVSPTGGTDARSQVYGNVDAGDVRPDLLELYRGLPGGLVIGVQLMEHDFGDPDRFKDRVRVFVQKASTAVEKGLEYVPWVGPVLSDIAERLLPELEDAITDFLNDALGTGDDDLGRTVVTLSAKQMVVLAARTPDRSHYEVSYKVETELLGANQGASYKVCFGLVAV